MGIIIIMQVYNNAATPISLMNLEAMPSLMNLAKASNIDLQALKAKHAHKHHRHHGHHGHHAHHKHRNHSKHHKAAHHKKSKIEDILVTNPYGFGALPYAGAFGAYAGAPYYGAYNGLYGGDY